MSCLSLQLIYAVLNSLRPHWLEDCSSAQAHKHCIFLANHRRVFVCYLIWLFVIGDKRQFESLIPDRLASIKQPKTTLWAEG